MAERPEPTIVGPMDPNTPRIIYPKPSTGSAFLDQRLNEWGIKLGVSVEDEEGVEFGYTSFVGVSHLPHVFLTQTLILKEKGVAIETIKDAMVMLGHGIAYSADQANWLFTGTGRRVTETVEIYERIAGQLDWPHLDALLVCRKNINPHIQEFVTHVFDRREIPYIFAEDTVTLERGNSRDGKISGIYNPLEGCKLMEADTSRWYQPEITRWRAFWSHRLNTDDIRTFPAWSRYPAVYR